MSAPESELLSIFDRLVRGPSDAADDGAPREDDGPVVRITHGWGGVVAAPSDTGLRGAELDRLIARQRDAFAARGLPVEWKTYGYDRPPDLPARLIAAGFLPEEEETLLVGPSAQLADLPSDAEGITIRETSDPADLISIGATRTEVWGEDSDWLMAELERKLAELGPDGIRILVAEAGGATVSYGWVLMREGLPFGSLWGGSTREAWRGRGIYTALVARRAAIARDAGFTYLQVDASGMSRPILERLGFIALTTTTPYIWRPAGDEPSSEVSAS